MSDIITQLYTMAQNCMLFVYAHMTQYLTLMLQPCTVITAVYGLIAAPVIE